MSANIRTACGKGPSSPKTVLRRKKHLHKWDPPSRYSFTRINNYSMSYTVRTSSIILLSLIQHRDVANITDKQWPQVGKTSHMTRLILIMTGYHRNMNCNGKSKPGNLHHGLQDITLGVLLTTAKSTSMVTASTFLNTHLEDPVNFMGPFVLGSTEYLLLLHVERHGILDHQPFRTYTSYFQRSSFMDLRPNLSLHYRRAAIATTRLNSKIIRDDWKISLNYSTTVTAPYTLKGPQLSKK